MRFRLILKRHQLRKHTDTPSKRLFLRLVGLIIRMVDARHMQPRPWQVVTRTRPLQRPTMRFPHLQTRIMPHRTLLPRVICHIRRLNPISHQRRDLEVILRIPLILFHPSRLLTMINLQRHRFTSLRAMAHLANDPAFLNHVDLFRLQRCSKICRFYHQGELTL